MAEMHKTGEQVLADYMDSPSALFFGPLLAKRLYEDPDTNLAVCFTRESTQRLVTELNRMGAEIAGIPEAEQADGIEAFREQLVSRVFPSSGKGQPCSCCSRLRCTDRDEIGRPTLGDVPVLDEVAPPAGWNGGKDKA